MASRGSKFIQSRLSIRPRRMAHLRGGGRNKAPARLCARRYSRAPIRPKELPDVMAAIGMPAGAIENGRIGCLGESAPSQNIRGKALPIPNP